MLILVRHGESTGNANGLLLGRTDSPLTALGRAQARSVGQLITTRIGALHSSPLLRARSTAALLDLDTDVEIDEAWIEVDYGEFEGQSLSGIPAELWRQWRNDPQFRPSGGETLADVGERVGAVCEQLFSTAGQGARSKDADVVVVSHVTPIKAAVAWALGAGGEVSWRLHLATASLTRIAWGNGAPVLESFNELAPERAGTPQSPRG